MDQDCFRHIFRQNICFSSFNDQHWWNHTDYYWHWLDFHSVQCQSVTGCNDQNNWRLLILWWRLSCCNDRSELLTLIMVDKVAGGVAGAQLGAWLMAVYVRWGQRWWDGEMVRWDGEVGDGEERWSDDQVRWWDVIPIFQRAQPAGDQLSHQVTFTPFKKFRMLCIKMFCKTSPGQWYRAA